MLSFTGSLKVFVALEACDMRKGYNGLHAAVTSRLKGDVRSGALFVFTNKKRTRLKMIYWDGTGLWLMGKRLEKGTLLKEKVDLLVRRIFGRSSEQLNEQQLMLLLQGGEKTEEPKKPGASQEAASVLEAELKSNETSVRRENKKRELRVPGHLPVSERLVIEPEEVKMNPRRIGM